jgi:hypothetical protein
MQGILCAELHSMVVDQLKEMTGAVVFEVSKRVAVKRRFIYLAKMIHDAIQQSKDTFVIMSTNWVKELAEADYDFIGAARAMDRVLLRFGAVHVVTESSFHAASVKMGTLQCPRQDVIILSSESPAQLAKLADDQRRRQSALALDPSILNLSGSPTAAKAILVGERINPYLDFEHWPFFDDLDSANFISHALEKGNVTEPSLAWTNAEHGQEDRIILEVLKLKPSIRVVALGQVAHEKLTSFGIVHSRVSHPQHARRFESRSNYDVILEQLIRG